MGGIVSPSINHIDDVLHRFASKLGGIFSPSINHIMGGNPAQYDDVLHRFASKLGGIFSPSINHIMGGNPHNMMTYFTDSRVNWEESPPIMTSIHPSI